MKTKTTKLIPLILAVLLLLTACTPSVVEREKGVGYFNYPTLEWGITEEEFFETIGKEASAFEFSEIPGAYIYTLRKGVFLDKEVDLSFFFLTELDGVETFEPFLFRVHGVFLESFSESEFPALARSFADEQKIDVFTKEEIQYMDQSNSIDIVDVDTFEKLNKENVETALAQYTVNSVALGSALPEEYLQKARENYVSSQGDEMTSEQAIKQFDALYTDVPLSSLYFSKRIIPEDKPTFTLDGLISQIDAYVELAN